MYFSEYFGVLCTFIINIFLVSVRCEKRYNVKDEALSLYNMDIERVVFVFRKSPEYLKILEDKRAETERFIQETFVSLYQGYKTKLQDRVRDDFPMEKLVDKKTTSKDCLNRYIFRRMANSTDFDFRIVKGKIMRRQKSFSSELDRREEIQPLEKYSKRHSPLKVYERNHYKDLGFNYSRGLIDSLLKALGDNNEGMMSTASWVSMSSSNHHDEEETKQTSNENAIPTTSIQTTPSTEHTTTSTTTTTTEEATIATTEETISTTTEETITTTTEESTVSTNIETTTEEEIPTTTEDTTTTITEQTTLLTNENTTPSTATITTSSTTENSITTTNSDCEESTETEKSEKSEKSGKSEKSEKTEKTTMDIWSYTCGPKSKGLRCGSTLDDATETSAGSTEVEVPGTTTPESPSEEEPHVETTKKKSPITISEKSGRRYGRTNFRITIDNELYYPQNRPKYRKSYQEYSDFNSQINYAKNWNKPLIQRNLLSRRGYTFGFVTQSDVISKQPLKKATKKQNALSNKNGRRFEQYQYMWSSREQAIASYRSLQDIMQKFDADRKKEKKTTESKVSLNFRSNQKKVTATNETHNLKPNKVLLKNAKDLSALSNEGNYEDLDEKKSKSKEDKQSLRINQDKKNNNIINKWLHLESDVDDNTFEDDTSKTFKLEWKYSGDIRNKNDVMMKANWDYDPRENPKVVYKVLNKHSSEQKTVNSNKHSTEQNSANFNKHFKESTSIYRAKFDSGDDTEYNSLHDKVNDKNEIITSPNVNSNTITIDKPKKIIIWDGRYTNSKDKNNSLLDRIDKKDLMLDEDTLAKLNGNKRMNRVINEIWKQGFRQGNQKNLWNRHAIREPIRGLTKNPNMYRRSSDENHKKPSNGAVRNRKQDEEQEINFSNSREKWSHLVRNSWSSKQIS